MLVTVQSFTDWISTFFLNTYICAHYVLHHFLKLIVVWKRKLSLLNATHFKKLFQHSFSHKFWFCESTAFPVMVTLCVMPEPTTVLLVDVVQRCLQSEKKGSVLRTARCPSSLHLIFYHVWRVAKKCYCTELKELKKKCLGLISSSVSCVHTLLFHFLS